VSDDPSVENPTGRGLPAAPRREACTALLAGALGAGLAPAAQAQPRSPVAPPLRVAFVYVSPVTDAGWTFQHDTGRREMEKALGAQVRTTAVEKVAAGPDAERVLRDLASQGHSLIFATSFGYMEPTLKVAREFPDVAFEHCSGFRGAPNVARYNARFYEGRWLAGMAAGRASTSNQLGYVAAYPIPEVLQGINAFTLGARSVNPKAQVRVVWTSSWFDPGRERDAAVTLINQGADVLTHHTDSSAVPQAAEARAVRVVSYHSDMSRAAPRMHLVSVTHHWGAYYEQRARMVLEGRWRPDDRWGGLHDGMVRVGPLSDAIPAETATLMRTREREVAEGRAHPFTGPVRDSEGQVRLAGGALSDADLGRIDWFVEGVVGKVPRG